MNNGPYPNLAEGRQSLHQKSWKAGRNHPTYGQDEGDGESGSSKGISFSWCFFSEPGGIQ